MSVAFSVGSIRQSVIRNCVALPAVTRFGALAEIPGSLTRCCELQLVDHLQDEDTSSDVAASIRRINSPIGIAEPVRAEPLFPWFSVPFADPALRRTDLLLIEQVSVQTTRRQQPSSQGQIVAETRRDEPLESEVFSSVVVGFHL
jgi:hypothetical protein